MPNKISFLWEKTSRIYNGFVYSIRQKDSKKTKEKFQNVIASQNKTK